MIAEGERNYLAELLSSLKEADLFSLSCTTTGGKVTPNNKNDAIECIILHSDSAESVLRRKKITKDFLFNYLHAKRVGVLVCDEKPKLIQYILQFWSGSTNLPQQVVLGKQELSSTASSTDYTSSGVNSTLEQRVTPIRPSESLTRNNSSTSTNSASSVSIDIKNSFELDEQTVTMLAFKFTEWFYNLLNKNFKGGLIAINADHFWNDASFILRIKVRAAITKNDIRNSVLEEDHVIGTSDIITLLNSMKDKYQIYFSPNLSVEGVRGKVDRHGGVLILACGTLHKDIGQMCGAFEQVFLIFRDPLTEYNWKIKNSELHLISVDQNNLLALPTINDTCLKVCLL